MIFTGNLKTSLLLPILDSLLRQRMSEISARAEERVALSVISASVLP